MTTKKTKKVKLDKEQIRMAQRYEKAWHKLFYECNRYKQELIVEEPHGRHANTLAHEAALLAESNAELN
jgi:hypothetical protein